VPAAAGAATGRPAPLRTVERERRSDRRYPAGVDVNPLRRKLAIATWTGPREGNIYGKLTVDMTEALAFVADERERTGERITVTHLVGRAVALALRKAPGLNGVIRFGRFRPHPHVDVTFLVALEEGRDLAKATVRAAEDKTVAEIAAELRAMAGTLHRGEDQALNKSKGAIRMMPMFMLRSVLRLTGYIASVLGWRLPSLGVEPFPFGSVIITNVGVFGLDEGFAPPTPFAHVPVYILMGAVRDTPRAVDGELTIRKCLTLTATIDHRFMDGAHGAFLARVVRDVLENPWQLREEGGVMSDQPASFGV
jgi:pyruvate dehydrogenase E2 component (dihydrolipoamide acetyltransferase)